MSTTQLQSQLSQLHQAIVYQRQLIAELEEQLATRRVNLHRLEGQHTALTTQLEITQQEEEANAALQAALQAEIAQLQAQVAGLTGAEPPAPSPAGMPDNAATAPAAPIPLAAPELPEGTAAAAAVPPASPPAPPPTEPGTGREASAAHRRRHGAER